MTLYTATITLVLVMDPLGNIPVFLSILRHFPQNRQKQIILRETIVAFIILSVFLFCGQYIMRGLNITASALSIAGAIILFLIAIRMIFPPDKKITKEDQEEPFIVPLAVPLTAGPSAIAMVLLFVTKDPGHQSMLFVAVLMATIAFLVIMLLGQQLMRVLGKRGLIAIERLMGMILTTIAVQMFLNGVVTYTHHLLK